MSAGAEKVLESKVLLIKEEQNLGEQRRMERVYQAGVARVRLLRL